MSTKKAARAWGLSTIYQTQYEHLSINGAETELFSSLIISITFGFFAFVFCFRFPRLELVQIGAEAFENRLGLTRSRKP